METKCNISESKDSEASLLLREQGHFSPTRYFEERNTRLEDLESGSPEEAGKYVKRKAKRLERERAWLEATADMSEDLSEREKADVPGEIQTPSESTKGRMSRISSVDVFENWFAQHKEKKLYIVLIRENMVDGVNHVHGVHRLNWHSNLDCCYCEPCFLCLAIYCLV